MTQDRLHDALDTLMSVIESDGFKATRDRIAQAGDREAAWPMPDWAETLLSDIGWAVERAGQAAAAAKRGTQPPRWIAISDAPGSRITWEWDGSGPDAPGNEFCAAVARSVSHVLGRSDLRKVHHDALRAALPVMRIRLWRDWGFVMKAMDEGDAGPMTANDWALAAPDIAAIRLATAIVGSQPDSAGVDTEWLDRAIAAAPETKL